MRTGLSLPNPLPANTVLRPKMPANRIKYLVIVICLAIRGLIQPAQTPAQNAGGYDLVIKNGRIIDGTGNPWFYGDLAISGDRIVSIGQIPSQNAKRTIDASGKVVSPGFIDIHSHSDDLLLEDGHAQSKIRQGVIGRPEPGAAAATEGQRAWAIDRVDNPRRLF
jgi:N-acyl-D-amino-acid deacylase